MRHRHRIKKLLIGILLSVIIFLTWRYAGRFYAELSKIKTSPEELPEARSRIEMVRGFFFSEKEALKEWEEKIFKGRVIYSIEKEDGLSYARAISDKAASALYFKIKMDARERRPVVSWKWQAVKFPVKKNKEDIEKESEDDFAARIYVIFPAMFLTNSKVLEYIWAETLPPGTTGTSPYSKNIKLMVLRSGLDKGKRWFFEERDIVDDYVKLFGRMPEYNIGAVAFMTNTEHTGTSAEAMYDEIVVGYKDVNVKGGDHFEDKVLKNKLSDR
jgi:hypothetical protein